MAGPSGQSAKQKTKVEYKMYKLTTYLVLSCVLFHPAATAWAVAPGQGQAASAEPAALPVAPVRDVTLSPPGVLHGAVVDSRGIPVRQLNVSLRSRNGQLVRTVTNVGGQFVAKGLSAGAYEVNTPYSSRMVRLWTLETAPPASQPGVLLVTPDPAIRGQQPISHFFNAERLLMAGVVAGAIIVPWVILDDRDSGS